MALLDAPPICDEVPKAGIRDALSGLQRYYRPGAHRSPLSRLGDRFWVELPALPKMLVTCSPQDARAAFTEREGVLSLGEALNRFSAHRVLFGRDNVIFLDGEEHLRERRKLAPPFHGELMKSYEPAIAAIALQRITSAPVGEPVEFLELTKGFVLDVMRSVIFGVSDDERLRRLDQAMLRYCRVVESDMFMRLGTLSVFFTGAWRRYPPLVRAAGAVDAIVLEEIAERRRLGFPDRPDFLTLYLKQNRDDGERRDDAGLARELRGLMLAGYETTAISLAWMADLLAHHPDALARLEESLDAGQTDYLNAVINEVLRMRPVFPFTARRATEDLELNGAEVQRGAVVALSIIALHERPDLYPDPLAFRPERFLESRPGTYTFVTFGGGAHRCVGAAFAQFESQVLFRTLLSQRSLAPVEKHRGERARRTHPMLVPEHGARVRLEARV